MHRPLFRWLAAHRIPLLLALPVFGLLAAGASIHARTTQQPVLLLITAWAEWFVALLLLPFPILAMGNWLAGRVLGVPRKRLAPLSAGYALALAVFALDLIFRAAFGLGWDPYFGN